MSVPRVLLLLLLLVLPTVAIAHPYGAAYFGHHLRVTVTRDVVRVEYRAEVPTQQVMREMAEHRWEERRSGERADFTGAVLDKLQDGLHVRADGELLALERLPVDPTGSGDATFFLYVLALEGALPEGASRIDVTNDNFIDKSAYFAAEVLVADDLVVDACSLLDVDGGRVLKDRTGQWVQDEDLRRITVEVSPRNGVAGMVRAVAGDGTYQQAADAVRVNPLVAMVQGDVTPGVAVLALLVAMFFGAAHALSPGHGKALVAGYLVGSRGTIGHAVLLGLMVTLSHVVSVVVLGLVTLLLAEHLAPEALFPWMELVSGALVLGVGGWLLYERTRPEPATCSHTPAVAPTLQVDVPAAIRDKVRVQTHTHDHGHTHATGSASHALAHLLGRDHDHALPHPDAPTISSLVSLGISGGMVPCPTALVVLLTAISLHRTALGLAMVGTFSVGLAAVLVGIAVAVVVVGERLKDRATPGALLRILPVASAVLVTLIGVAITVRSVAALVG